MKTLFLLAFVLSQVSRVAETPARPGTGLFSISGQLTGSTEFAGLPITLYGPSVAPLQTFSGRDGAFSFQAVSAGNYVLRAPGFTPLNVTVENKDLGIDLSPIYSGPGARVSGKVTGEMPGLAASVVRTVTLAPQLPGPRVAGGVTAFGGILGAPLSTALEAWVRPDGTFEFPSVPAGSYTLRSLPAAVGTTSRVEVGSNDVRDIEIKLPFQMEVAGRVILEGRDLGPNATVEAALPTFTAATGIHTDGSFKLRLTEGKNQIALTRLPPDYAVRQVLFGDKDVTHSPLTIHPTTTPREIVITLDTTVTGSGFPGVSSQTSARTIVAGSVIVVDGDGQPHSFRPEVSMVFTLPTGDFGTAGLRADGTFSVPLADDRYSTTIGNLPAEYSIRPIHSGSIDLLKNPLVVDVRRVPDNIVVVLQYHPAKAR